MKQNECNLSNIKRENSRKVAISRILKPPRFMTVTRDSFCGEFWYRDDTICSVRSHALPRAENEVAFTSLAIHFADVLVGECTQSATKKLPKWVSETGEETRSQPASVRMGGIDRDLN